MSLTVFLTVLLAAFLHASWNVLVRHNPDRLASLASLQTLMGLIGAVMIVAYGLPSPHAIGFAVISGLLHTGYNLFLVRAYRAADLSLVYPVARGSAPLMTMIGAFLLLQDAPGVLGVIAVLVLVAGLLITGLGSQNHKHVDPNALKFAFGTACFIAVYTLVDGMGARASGNAMGYAGLLFVFDALFLLVAGSAIRGIGFSATLLPHWKPGLVGAVASGAAYAIIIWAMTKAPIASVAALRETSIVFVLIMSSRVLNESLTRSRVFGALLIAAGTILMRLA